jgi:hypothetical protein
MISLSAKLKELSIKALKTAWKSILKIRIKSVNSKNAQECRNKLEITEINGPKGPEPTRYGDWERQGKASDF